MMNILGITVAILVMLLPIALVIMIIVALVRHNKNADSSDSFEKSIRSIFVYLILISMLCSIIGGTILLFNSAINLVLPEKDYIETSSDSYYYDTATTLSTISARKIVRPVDNSERNMYIVNMITAASILLVCIPVFAYFSKIARKETVKK